MRSTMAHAMGWLAGLLVVGTAGLVIQNAIPTQVMAAEQSPFANPQCPTVEEVVKLLTSQGETVVVLDVKSVLGVTADAGSGRIVLSTFSGKTYAVFGYEVGGCVNGPTPIAKVASGV